MPNEYRARFCQRCAKEQKLYDSDHPLPCKRCGGTNFDLQPKKHSTGRFFELTASDVVFMRVNRIGGWQEFKEDGA